VITQYDGKRKRDSGNNAIKMMPVLRIDITVYYNRYHGNAIDDVVVVVDDDNLSSTTSRTRCGWRTMMMMIYR
jgi:hypothetical protein